MDSCGGLWSERQARQEGSAEKTSSPSAAQLCLLLEVGQPKEFLISRSCPSEESPRAGQLCLSSVSAREGSVSSRDSGELGGEMIEARRGRKTKGRGREERVGGFSARPTNSIRGGKRSGGCSVETEGRRRLNQPTSPLPGSPSRPAVMGEGRLLTRVQTFLPLPLSYLLPSPPPVYQPKPITVSDDLFIPTSSHTNSPFFSPFPTLGLLLGLLLGPSRPFAFEC